MKVALLGMMQSGKTSLLAAVTGKEMVPGAAIVEEIIPVPDERLEWLSEMYKPKKTIHATIDCLDLPGLFFTDEHGRAAARRLLQDIRTVGIIVLVIRAFDDPRVPAYRNSVDPVRDLAELKDELFLYDLELVTTRIERLEKQIAKGGKNLVKDRAELAIQKKLEATIEAGKPISSAISNDKEEALIRSLNFLTMKPISVVVNVGEDQLEETFSFDLDPSVPVTTLCASLEKELAQLDSESRREFMDDLGITEPAINKFVNQCYSALGLISFLTCGPDEVRAWPIRRGQTAHEAAGKIHSDIHRGFIRAETIAYDDLKSHGSEKAVKAAGKARLEGKTYVVQDGDIIEFRFNI